MYHSYAPHWELTCRSGAYTGPDGAKKILAQMSSNHSTLDISRNLLGTAGLIVLLKGIETTRIRETQKRRRKEAERGLDTFRVDHGEVVDAGLEKIMGHVAKWGLLQSLNLCFNKIELKHHVASILTSINSSTITSLDLSGNHLILPDALASFLAGLNAPHLATLSLADCKFGPAASHGIAAFIRSPNSKHLHHLSLMSNAFGYAATVAIIDSLEEGNFTLSCLDLWPAVWPSGKVAAKRYPGAGYDRRCDSELRVLVEPEDVQFRAELDRISVLCSRNVALTRRVRKAAYRYLPIARVILNARSPPPPASSAQVLPRVRGLADLPAELIYRILRDSSYDSEAFSTAQFARLIKEAEGKAGLRKAMAARRSIRGQWLWELTLKERVLEEGGWMWWERD